jgi:hypothetical protein
MASSACSVDLAAAMAEMCGRAPLVKILKGTCME